MVLLVVVVVMAFDISGFSRRSLIKCTVHGISERNRGESRKLDTDCG
jgi:hypothetical protein